jgi:hypothetical protein
MTWWRPLNGPAARLARVAVVALSMLAAATAVVVIVVPLLGRAVISGIQLLVAACVWTATSIGVGLSIWDVLGTIGRAAARGLTTPTASVLLGVLVAVGIMAMYLLQRLLESEFESEEESSQ